MWGKNDAVSRWLNAHLVSYPLGIFYFFEISPETESAEFCSTSPEMSTLSFKSLADPYFHQSETFLSIKTHEKPLRFQPRTTCLRLFQTSATYLSLSQVREPQPLPQPLPMVQGFPNQAEFFTSAVASRPRQLTEETVSTTYRGRAGISPRRGDPPRWHP